MTEGSGTPHVCIACGYETILWDPDAEFACPECDEEILLTEDQAEAVRRDRQERAMGSLGDELCDGGSSTAVVAIQQGDTVRTFRGVTESYTFEVSPSQLPSPSHPPKGISAGDTLSLDMAVTDITEQTDPD